MFSTAAAVLTGCSGGGSNDNAGTVGVAPQGQAAVAKASLPADGKVAWNLTSPAAFALTNGTGASVAGALTCSSDVPAALAVAADCSWVKGMRLGAQAVTVSGGGFSAKASVKVIPQPQPIGTGSYAGHYNLAVTPEGKVLAWGQNPPGATLGQGKSAQELPGLALPAPVKAPAGQGELTGIVAAAGGSRSAYALTEDGEVYSWGSSSYGLLGRPYGGSGDTLPGKVVAANGGTLQKIVSISAGDNNVVALADDGTVFYWGAGPWSGQSSAPEEKVPLVVPGLAGPAVAVSAGFNWSAALLADGRMVTWGYNSGSGNLGRGKIAEAVARVPGFVLDETTGAPLSGLTSISAGRIHGMALNMAGQVHAWGRNENGELGQGETPNNRPDHFSAVLVKAPGGAAAWSGAKMVAAGANHSLAMDGAGQVFSWGYAQNGELGDGPTHPRVNSSSLPAPVVNLTGMGQLGGVAAIAAGDGYSLALADEGRLLIWGHDGDQGNLGQGSTPVLAFDKGSKSFVPLAVKDAGGAGTLGLGPLGYWPNLTRRGVF